MARNRKTVAEMKLSGTFNKHSEHKDWNTETPCIMDSIPETPSYYLKETKQAWDCFMQAKTTQRILSNEDKPLINMMFDSLDSYLRYTNQLRPLLKPDSMTDNLDTIERLCKLQKKSMESFTTIAIKFGLTPIERSKLTITKPVKEKSPMLTLIDSVMASKQA